jgi:protoporphyrinogen oxidase
LQQYCSDTRFDAIVLGAGISGLVSAYLLADRGKKVLLLDDYAEPGGNHISREIGGMSFDIGCFFFHENSAFFRHFPQLLPLYQPAEAQVVKVRPDGEISCYPFDLKRDLLSLPLVRRVRIALSLMRARLTVNPKGNALDFVTYSIGTEFGNASGLIPYLRRFYSAEPALIEGSFARKRMGWVARNATLKGVLQTLRRRSVDEKHACFVRPKGGFHEIYSKVADMLREKGVVVQLAAAVQAIAQGGDGSMTVACASGSVCAAELFSTVPLATALRCCGLPVPSGLKSATLISLFYSFIGKRGFNGNVLYNFHDRGLWKRVTVHSDFYGDVKGRAYFSVEFTVTGEPLSLDQYDRDFRADTASKRLFEGDLALEGTHVLDHAYPVYLQGATATADRAVADLAKFGVKSFGRQGGFDYQPTADVSASMAEKTVSAALST